LVGALPALPTVSPVPGTRAERRGGSLTDQRAQYAIHEAGHALLCLVLGVPVVEAELRDRELARADGVTVYGDPSGGVVRHQPTDAVSNAVIALAGPCAESIWLNQRGAVFKRHGVLDRDLDEAARDVAELFGPEDALEVVAVLSRATTAALTVAWADVERLAKALGEGGPLSGAALDRLVDVSSVLTAIRADAGCVVFHGLPTTPAEVQALLDAVPVEPAEPAGGATRAK
jgi:hypothetical protein